MAIGMETRKFAAHQVTKLLERLAFQISRARHAHDAEAVHDLRVAIRRFTQALAAFQPCFAPKEVKKIRRRLKDTMALAGQVRDRDIALKYLSGLRSPDAAAVREGFQEQRQAAHGALVTALKRWVQRRTSSKWRDGLETVGETDGFGLQPIEETARQDLPRLARGFFKCGNRAADAKSSAEELHQFRIAAKKFRYSLELFASFYEPAASDWLARITGVQSLLGRINDYRTVRIMMAEAGANPRIEASLKKRQRRKTDEFRQLWADQFSSPDTAREWIQAMRNAPKKPIERSAAATPGAHRAAGD